MLFICKEDRNDEFKQTKYIVPVASGGVPIKPKYFCFKTDLVHGLRVCEET